MTFCAETTVLPTICAYASSAGADSMPNGASARMRPSRPTMARTGSASSRHQITSVRSPNVQIMATPVPFSGSASSWARMGTSTSNNGVRTVVPNKGL